MGWPVEALNPVQAGLFGADAVMLEPDFVANLIEQLGLDSHNPLYFNGCHGQRW
jgi:hypothetical protein